jgi:hypothetical protein
VNTCFAAPLTISQARHAFVCGPNCPWVGNLTRRRVGMRRVGTHFVQCGLSEKEEEELDILYLRLSQEGHRGQPFDFRVAEHALGQARHAKSKFSSR